jgi:hypothetical protein
MPGQDDRHPDQEHGHQGHAQGADTGVGDDPGGEGGDVTAPDRKPAATG